MILIVDNYDSFVHNVARYFEELSAATRVVRNDHVSEDDLAAAGAIVISPGPCTPNEAGVSVEAIRRALSQKGYTQVAALEPESWRVPTLPWVTPSDPREDVTLDPANGVVEGPWDVLRQISRRLRAAGAG